MKKLIILLALTAGLTVTSCQEKKEQGEEKDKYASPPTAVAEALVAQFPGATAEWVKEGSDYEANFKLNGEEMSATFSEDGTLLETEVEMEKDALPSSILEYIKANYNEEVEEAAKITKANGKIFYEAEVNDIDIIFDANGNFVKEGKE